jgi:uncharacterized membrane protein YkvI
VDWNLTLHGQIAYRIAQCISVLVVVLRVFSRETRPYAAYLLGPALLAGVLLLGSIVRGVGGNFAGATSLVLIPLYPQLVAFSSAEATAFFCLTALMWLLATRDWTRHASNLPLSLSFAALVTLGS